MSETSPETSSAYPGYNTTILLLLSELTVLPHFNSRSGANWKDTYLPTLPEVPTTSFRAQRPQVWRQEATCISFLLHPPLLLLLLAILRHRDRTLTGQFQAWQRREVPAAVPYTCIHRHCNSITGFLRHTNLFHFNNSFQNRIIVSSIASAYNSSTIPTSRHAWHITTTISDSSLKLQQCKCTPSQSACKGCFPCPFPKSASFQQQKFTH